MSIGNILIFCKEISAAAAVAKILAVVFRRLEMALRCLCTQILPPPPLKLCIEILPPLQLLALKFYVPPFSTAPPAVNNDHSLTRLNISLLAAVETVQSPIIAHSQMIFFPL